MLSKKVEEALNAQINAEFWSAHLYLSMSVFSAADGKPGFSKWFKVQFFEEQQHATKLIDFVIARGGKVTLKPIGEVTTSWDSPQHLFEDTLKHEEIVTEHINKLIALMREEKDYATESFLQWYLDEQVEEESTIHGILEALKHINGNGMGIYMLDKDLGGRQ